MDPYRLPTSVYPTIKYDGGLLCSLLRDENPAMEEPYPPGTWVEDVDEFTKVTKSGTVMDVPFSNTESPHYLLLFDDGTTKSVSASDMSPLIPKPPDSEMSNDDALLPPFFRMNCKITYEHEGQYHKGYLTKSLAGVYRFSFKSHVNKKKEDWGVSLPNLSRTWTTMCAEGILLPGHNTSSFICSSAGTTCDPVASIVSAVNLHCDCPASLLCALTDNHPDRSIWLQSFYEEKNSIDSLGTIHKLTLGEYRALREKGAPRAIPSMCVLTIKRDENMLPVRAKSRIVVLGNHEDRNWSKSERFAPVLRSESLRFLVSLAVEQCRVLQQGDCKNAFCQSDLPQS